jgi:hypothetical protein
MSDQEMKEQIERQILKDTKSWCDSMVRIEEEYHEHSHWRGRCLQDKVAMNRTVEEALGIAHALISDKITCNKVIKELEKLRR